MIKTEVVICKFHAKSNFHVTRSVFQRLKCSSSSQSLVFSFPRFSCDCFFPVYRSDRSFLSFLVVNVVVNMQPVHFYWIRWSNITQRKSSTHSVLILIFFSKPIYSMMFFNLLQLDKKKSKCSEKNTNFGENAKIGVRLPPPPPPPYPLLIF